MRLFAQISLLLVCMFAMGRVAGAHGIPVLVNTDLSGNPISFKPVSQSPYLDSGNTPGYSNMFFGSFGATPTTDGTGTWYGANDGFAATSGPWPPYTLVTFDVISPLYYSDGTGPAVPASAGTFLDIKDRFPNNSDGNHPGATAGDIQINGLTSPTAGYGVSLFDTHELSKHLYLGAGSTQTSGQYGFGFTITVHFTAGQTLTSGPMVEVFSLKDPNLPGGSFLAQPLAVQQAATNALYTSVPEPSTLVMAGCSCLGLVVVFIRARARRRAG